MRFIALTIFAFAAMEAFSYLAHRLLFHGVLWSIHRTHHQSNKFFIEPNDVFSLIFALLSIGLMIFADAPLLNSYSFPIGLGIALYGIVYFITHDFFTHRRFLPFKSTNKILLAIRAAHQRHHQTTDKSGVEPFGLFIFDYAKFGRKITTTRHERKDQEKSILDLFS